MEKSIRNEKFAVVLDAAAMHREDTSEPSPTILILIHQASQMCMYFAN